jgi:hypothetical protein
MGGMPVHDKVPVRERLPQDLIAMMKEASDLIDEGDESARIVSDDLLQWEMCYGGLCDAEKQMFGFSYFPAVPSDKNEVSPPKWFLYFSREQIRAIANGSVTQIEMWRCQGNCHHRFWTPQSYCNLCDSGSVPPEWGW